MSRKEDMILYHWKYDRINFSQYTCFYCGEAASNFDHCPPISKCYLYPELKKLYLIPSCRECNIILHNITHFEPWERLVELKSLLRKRYADVVLSPDWTNKELKELGDNLKRYISNSQKKKDIIIKRLNFYPDWEEEEENESIEFDGYYNF